VALAIPQPTTVRVKALTTARAITQKKSPPDALAFVEMANVFLHTLARFPEFMKNTVPSTLSLEGVLRASQVSSWNPFISTLLFGIAVETAVLKNKSDCALH